MQGSTCGRGHNYSDRRYAILMYRYKQSVVARSKRRGWDLTTLLSFDAWEELVLSPCRFCGVVGGKEVLDRYGKRKPLLSGTIVYLNGIDRIDSNLGYTLENSQSCCEVCNKAKLDSSDAAFILWARSVVKHTEGELL